MTAVELTSAPKVWTEEEILNLPDNGYKYEVVNGELTVSPKNNREHGRICVRISISVGSFVIHHRLGEVWDSNTGCWMVNKNLRAPDVSFVSKERLKGMESLQEFFKGAPDLVVEVLSWSNTRAEIDKRLKDYFASGTKLAWIIDAERQFAEVCRSLTDRNLIGADGILDGEDVLPEFKLSLAEIFEPCD